MAVAKVILNGTTLIDVTQKTVTAGNLLNGYTALKNDGTSIIGEYVPSGATLQSKSVTYTPTTSQQTESVTPDNGYDGLSSVSVTVNAMPSGSATTPSTYITVDPVITVSASGLIEATSDGSENVTPTVVAGYVSSGTSGTVRAYGYDTYQLPTQAATTITPSTSSQTAVTAGKYTTGSIIVNPIPSQYIVPSGTLNITSNGTVDVTQYASANVNVNPSPTTAPYNDVNFWDDYTGKIVYSYSASEFQSLTEMPPNPTHDGMTSQGWNWTLADAKAQLSTTGYLSIGQMYVTSDGKTRAYITIPNNLRKTVRVNWNQTVAYSVSVDFGDGSSAVTVSGTGNKNAVHEYATCGDYVITLTVSSGTMRLGNGGTSTTVIQSGESSVRYPYCAMLRRLEIGSNVTDIRDNCLYNSFLLNALTIPNNVTTINGGAFYACNSLTHITIPSSCTEIKGENAFRACRALYDLSLPKRATTVSGSSIFRDNQIINIALPNFTTITEYMLAIGGVISKIVIPATVTSIAANAFNGNSGMKEYHFKSTTPPTLADDNAFTSIPTDCIIYVPSSSLSQYQTAWSTYSSHMVGE